MMGANRISQYFNRSAAMFDSLYLEGKMNPLIHLINRYFRRDIYERFILTVDYVRRYKIRTILDVGCGSGQYACALAQLGIRRLVGVDFSQKMIDLAEENISRVQFGDGIFEFICSDFMKFQTEERFDVVIAMGFFDYIKDAVPVLQKMKDLTNHLVLASFPSISICRTPIRKIRYYFKQCPVYFYKHNDIVSFCEKSGFADKKIVKIKGSGMDYFTVFFR